METTPNERTTVLIVDDNPANLRSLFDFLQVKGFKTLAATGGERAFRLLERSLPDIILLDVLMPGIDGFDICRALKADDATKDIPVLFMTGLTDTVDKVKGFEMGAVDYLTKPLQYEEVLARIHAHLTIRNFQQQLTQQNALLHDQNVQLEEQQRQLRESEARFRRLSEATFEGILIHDQGRIVDFNSVVEHIFGYQRAEIIEKNALEFVAPEFRAMVQERIRTHDETPYEASGIKQDGTLLPIEVQAKSMPYQGREIRVAAIRDLTWRKRMEAEKARLQQQQLIFSMETLGFVTHELKAPLSTMQTMIAVMLDGFAGELSDKIEHYLRRIRRNCEELQDMVKNYLDISRMSGGELPVRKSVVDYTEEVVKPCVEHTRILFNSHGMSVHVDAPEELMIEADSDLLQIALTNYLTNAAKYGREQSQVIVTVMEEQNSLSTTVRNEGGGFSAEERSALFARFSRLKNENTVKKRGSGLGLYLTKHILEQHAGTVWANSVPEEWTEFGFSVPLHADTRKSEA